MYPTANEQHDFMYTKMIPTMQKVLSEIRDTTTLKVNRDYVEDLNLSGTANEFIPWNKWLRRSYLF